MDAIACTFVWRPFAQVCQAMLLGSGEDARVEQIEAGIPAPSHTRGRCRPAARGPQTGGRRSISVLAPLPSLALLPSRPPVPGRAPSPFRLPRPGPTALRPAAQSHFALPVSPPPDPRASPAAAGADLRFFTCSLCVWHAFIPPTLALFYMQTHPVIQAAGLSLYNIQILC